MRVQNGNSSARLSATLPSSSRRFPTARDARSKRSPRWADRCRVLDEAARGVRFDQMAIVLRSPEHYVGLLEHACERAGVRAYFDRGTRRPDPGGRAFIALLSCACEGLSAKRFDEYLSLGQVPV